MKTICLRAPLEVVRNRLKERAAIEKRSGLSDFELRRSSECVAAHADPVFGQQVDATGSPEAITAEIRALICR